MRAAAPELPAKWGIELANWNWKVVRQFVLERFGINLSRSSCLNYLHRLGFVLKRPKKRLVKADEAKREAFVAEYAARWEEAVPVWGQDILCRRGPLPGGRGTAGPVGAQGRAGPPLPRGQALVESTSPRYGEKASYYSAVCLETGEVEWMELEGNSNSGTSAAFLRQLRERHSGPLTVIWDTVIWDNAPAHRGEAVREYLRTPGLHLGLVNPRFHEGRLGQATVRTSMAMKLSGAGPGKRPRGTCAWGPGWRCRGRSATSSPAWPVGKKKRSRGAAEPYCNPEPKVSPATHSLIPNALQLHIPPWL